MSPVGHISVSYILTASASKITILSGIIGALLVDFDFIFLPFPWFNEIHRVVTHNIFFVFVLSLLGWFVVKGEYKKYVMTGLLIGGMSHLIIDALMDSNPSNGMGVAFFWPLINQNFLIYNFLPPTAENTTGWQNPSEMMKFSFLAILIELPFYIVAATIFIIKKIRKSNLKTIH